METTTSGLSHSLPFISSHCSLCARSSCHGDSQPSEAIWRRWKAMRSDTPSPSEVAQQPRCVEDSTVKDSFKCTLMSCSTVDDNNNLQGHHMIHSWSQTHCIAVGSPSAIILWQSKSLSGILSVFLGLEVAPFYMFSPGCDLYSRATYTQENSNNKIIVIELIKIIK